MAYKEVAGATLPGSMLIGVSLVLQMITCKMIPRLESSDGDAGSLAPESENTHKKPSQADL